MQVLRNVLRGMAALTLAISGGLFLQVAAPAPSLAADVPWTCGDAAYLFQSPNNTAAPHLVQSVNLLTGESTNVGTTANLVNAVAYNPLDNYMYAWNLQTDTLNRISSDLSLINLGVPAATPTAFRGIDYNVGEIDDSGRLWIMDNQTGRWLEIDVNPASPTYTRTLASGITPAPANLILPGDWAFVNGVLYGVAPTSAGTGAARLVSFNLTTHTFTNLGILAGTVSGSTFGAIYSDGTYLYVSRNQGGNIYRIDPATLETIQLAVGVAATSNDGARCRSAIIPTVTVRKLVGGRLVPADQFHVALRDGTGTTVTDVTTTGTQTSVTSTAYPVERGATYLITDELAAGSTSLGTDYTGALSCTVDGTPAAERSSGINVWSLPIGVGNDYVCTVTNTPDAANPALTLAKSVAPSDAASFTVGRTLTYSFVVTNAGNVPVTNLAITEVAFSGTGTLGAASCPVTTLAARAQTTCTATYVVTQADVDAGVLTNTARATGSDPGGDPVDSNDDSTEIPSDPAPELTLDKSATPAVAIQAGQQITYTFVVTNTGNVTISGLAIAEDSFTGSGTIGTPSCDRTTLIAGQQATCTATYAVTQADLDAGDPLANTATASGTDPGGGPVDSPPDDAVVDVVQSPHLTLIKNADPTTVSAAGDQVTYTFAVTNDGNITLDSLSIEEDSFSGSGTHPVVSCPVLSLAPTESTTCQGLYAVTQADIDAGQITNAAHAQGRRPDNNDAVLSNTDDALVGVVPVQSLTLVKTADPTTVSSAGGTISYSFLVTNGGNQTVTGLAITELSFTGTGATPVATCPVTTLAAGANTTCTASYTVTQADIDSGRIDNIAQAGGTNPAGGDVVSNEDDATVTAPENAVLTLTKTATPTSVTAAGDTVTYTYTVTNGGNVTIDDLTIAEDSFTGTGTLATAVCAATTLAPEASTTCTATYTVTTADITAGEITNVGHATGDDPGGNPVVSPPDDAVVDTPGSPAITVAKSAQPQVVSAVGDVVTYTFHVVNTGTTELADVTVEEGAFNGSGQLSAITCPQTSLAQGAAMNCTATYAVTSADLLLPRLTNTATATGTPPSGPPTRSDPSTANVAPTTLTPPVPEPLTGDTGAGNGSDDLGGTGSPLSAWTAPLALLLLITGGALIHSGHRGTPRNASGKHRGERH